MYSPNSPVLSSLDQYSSEVFHRSQCLKFKYFTTFLVSFACLALLSASLATHKWIVSKPIRVIKLNGGPVNITSLLLTAHLDHYEQHQQQRLLGVPSAAAQYQPNNPANPPDLQGLPEHSNKFQGEIYFGLFKGVKLLNYGLGDRVSLISVLQFHSSKEASGLPQQHPPHELVDFKLWLATLSGVVVAIVFALISSIFAIINFVMTPGGTMSGPVGLVVWNSIACFACLIAIVSWMVDYFFRLQVNVLSPEEVQNGWTSEKRSQFGYSFYFVLLAFSLHLVNIFIVSIVQFESWNNNKAALRTQSRTPTCEGVIMLY